MVRVALLIAVALLASGAKKGKGKRSKEPKQIETQLAGIDLGGAIDALPKGLHKHTAGTAAFWDACNQKDQVRFLFHEEPFLPGKVAAVSVAKVESILCSHDATALPDLRLASRTPRGVKLGSAEKDIVAAYGAPAERGGDDAIRTLRYRGALERKDEQPIKTVLIFELRNLKLTSVRLMLEPSAAF